MNNYDNSKKLNYQLQEMAFQKYPFQINNKTFFCLETYFEDELLNGIDLQLKQAKGISSEPQRVTYIAQNQDLILTIGSNIVAYCSQKRSYSLLTEVTGYIEILKSYSCKINNRNYLFWLQSDQQGLNQRIIKDQDNNSKDKQGQKKITSIWNLFEPGGFKLKKQKQSQEVKKNENIQQDQKKVKFKVDQNNETKHQKSKKKVTIDAASIAGLNEKQESNSECDKSQKVSTNKKRMRICIFDYEKRILVHKQVLEIQQNETISDIILYFTSQKIVGYVINDSDEQRGKIYYKKLKVDEMYFSSKTTISRRSINIKKKQKSNSKKVGKYSFLNSIFEIPTLKYNGETDQYLFKDLNTIYSLQFYEAEHQVSVKGTSHKLNGGKGSKKKSQRISSNDSISSNELEEMNQENLSKQIEKITHNIVEKKQTLKVETEKYKLKICEQIELYTDETIIDFAISETYLVVLTNEQIRFYSIYNLNTLLFKHQLENVKGIPLPSSIQLNKSYLLITHENSTFVSSYSILQRKLKYNSICEIQIEHCQAILKIFMNSYNCEVVVLARQYEIQGRMTNIIKSKKVIQNTFNGYKKSFIDISLAYINFSSTKCQSKPLFLKNQKFRNILTCKWHSEYLVQTQNEILSKQWRQSFENLKCSCLHPTGQYLIIGFSDCFKIYAVTQEGLQNTYMSDCIKQCQAIAYSEYGQHFAVGSGNTIGIYNSYNSSKKLVISLPMGSLVQNIEYRSSHLICTLKSKRVIVYHTLLDYKQVFTFNSKHYLNQNKHEFQRKQGQSAQNLLALTIKGLAQIEVYSIYYDLELNVVIFSSGKKLFFLNTLTNEILGNFDFESISCMEYNKHLATLFMGTNNGELICFPWPNKPSNILSDLPIFKFHCQKIVKIKLTSDFKHLITIGNDMSLYKSNISYILNLKRLKGTEIVQYKGNQNGIGYVNFLYNKGVCQFSHSQNIQKLENKKQLQEQVVNTIFMLPEQRLKQKQVLFDKLNLTKQQLTQQNRKQYEPLQEQSVGLRNKIIKLKEELSKLYKTNEESLDKEKETFKEKTSKLLNDFSELNRQYRSFKLDFKEEAEQIKFKQNKQYRFLIQQNEQKYKILKERIQTKQKQCQKEKTKFLEVDLLEEEKDKYLTDHLQSYVKEVELLMSKNGQLSCKNSSIEKQIHILKYRIEQLKFVCLNSTASIQKLTEKKQKQQQQKLIFEKLLIQNAKIDVSEMQKKYIKATKQLIQKNKEIDINLNQYEKQKEILVRLEKTVEKTQLQIDRIVEDLTEEKNFQKELIQKYTNSTERLNELIKFRDKKKLLKRNMKFKFKNFLSNLENIQQQHQDCINSNHKQINFEEYNLIKALQLLLNQGESLKPGQETEGRNLTKKQNGNNFDRKQKDQSSIDPKRQSKTILGQLISSFKKSNNSLQKQKKYKTSRNYTEGSQHIGYEDEDKTNQFRLTNIKLKFNKSSSKLNSNRSSQGILQPSKSSMSLRSTRRYNQIKTQSQEKSFTGRQFFKSNGLDLDCDQQIFAKKQNILNKFSTEQKMVDKIKTDRKLYISAKKKMHIQNQDLITTYNSLAYDNKYFQNVLKIYEQAFEDGEMIDNQNFKDLTKQFISKDKLTRSNDKKEQRKKTPFDNYLSQKQTKRLQTKRYKQVQTGLKKQGRVKVNEKRLKTLPCVEIIL